MFVVVSALLMIVFGAVLEGAPALIIFGPAADPDRPTARRPSAALRHRDGDRHGARPVLAADRAGPVRHLRHGQVRLQDVVKPYLKYLSILLVALLLIAALGTEPLVAPPVRFRVGVLRGRRSLSTVV